MGTKRKIEDDEETAKKLRIEAGSENTADQDVVPQQDSTDAVQNVKYECVSPGELSFEIEEGEIVGDVSDDENILLAGVPDDENALLADVPDEEILLDIHANEDELLGFENTEKIVGLNDSVVVRPMLVDERQIVLNGKNLIICVDALKHDGDWENDVARVIVRDKLEVPEEKDEARDGNNFDENENSVLFLVRDNYHAKRMGNKNGCENLVNAGEIKAKIPAVMENERLDGLNRTPPVPEKTLSEIEKKVPEDVDTIPLPRLDSLSESNDVKKPTIIPTITVDDLQELLDWWDESLKEQEKEELPDVAPGGERFFAGLSKHRAEETVATAENAGSQDDKVPAKDKVISSEDELMLLLDGFGEKSSNLLDVQPTTKKETSVPELIDLTNSEEDLRKSLISEIRQKRVSSVNNETDDDVCSWKSSSSSDVEKKRPETKPLEIISEKPVERTIFELKPPILKLSPVEPSKTAITFEQIVERNISDLKPPNLKLPSKNATIFEQIVERNISDLKPPNLKLPSKNANTFEQIVERNISDLKPPNLKLPERKPPTSIISLKTEEQKVFELKPPNLKLPETKPLKTPISAQQTKPSPEIKPRMASTATKPPISAQKPAERKISETKTSPPKHPEIKPPTTNTVTKPVNTTNTAQKPAELKISPTKHPEIKAPTTEKPNERKMSVANAPKTKPPPIVIEKQAEKTTSAPNNDIRQLQKPPDQTPATKKPNKSYGFVSSDPRENSDNFHSDWAPLRDAPTDAVRYRLIRERWRSMVVPDPTKNLSCRHAGLFMNTSPKTQRQRAGRHTRTMSCSSVYERELQALRNSRRTREHNLMMEQSLEINNLCMQHQAYLNQLRFVTGFENFPFVQFEQAKELAAMFERHSVVMRNYNAQADAEIRKLNEYVMEVRSFHQFYRGLVPNDRSDKTILTEEQTELKEEVERMFDAYKRFY